MIEFLIISAAFAWACTALFSPWFNHLDNIEKYTDKKISEQDKND